MEPLQDIRHDPTRLEEHRHRCHVGTDSEPTLRRANGDVHETFVRHRKTAPKDPHHTDELAGDLTSSVLGGENQPRPDLEIEPIG